MAVVPKLIGERVKRREDPRLITGTATYVDDLRLPGMLHAMILRSPHAHAKINAIEVAAARTAPGVIGVFTGADLKDKIGSLPCVAVAENKPFHPVLAAEKVRYVGEPVVVAVATDSYKAQDALDRVEVDYDPLDAVTDPERALAAGAPLIHEEFQSNLVHRAEVPNPAVADAMRKADRIIKFRLVSQRLAPIPIEARGAVSQWHQASQQLTLCSSTQIPHLLRSAIAAMLKLAENRTRVIAPEVGGGFGGKLNVYREEALVAFLAKTLNRPVKWIERRRENLAAATHGRDQIADVEVAVRSDGVVLAMKAKFICDMGAYLQLFTPLIPGFSGLMMSGCYKIPAVAFEQVMVFTNKMATDAYRGAGRPEAAYIAERTMDLVAAELGLDPVEVRRRNFVPKEAFPYTTSTGLIYDTGDYHAALEKALTIIDYKRLRIEQAEARKNGRLLGIGIASYVEICGLGPSAMFPAGVQGWESSTVRIEPDGKVTVLTGISPHGQGQETTFAQMAAEAFGIDMDDVAVVHGDTAIVQYGVGTFGSRGLTLGGTAMMISVGKLQEKLRKIAATMMETPPEQLTFHNRTVALATDLAKSIPFTKSGRGSLRL